MSYWGGNVVLAHCTDEDMHGGDGMPLTPIECILVREDSRVQIERTSMFRPRIQKDHSSLLPG
jgi:hypothetical protein